MPVSAPVSESRNTTESSENNIELENNIVTNLPESDSILDVKKDIELDDSNITLEDNNNSTSNKKTIKFDIQ